MKKFTTYIISDIHLKVRWIELFIDSLNGEYDEIVFLGDYMDDFGDNKEKVETTAHWLKQSLYKPKRIHLFGNHDISYAYPYTQGLYCSGYTMEKSKCINSILNRKEWNMMKLYHQTHNNWYLSHGGLTKHHVFHPIYGFKIEFLKIGRAHV